MRFFSAVLLSVSAADPAEAGTITVSKGVETAVASWQCSGVYCSHTICIQFVNVTDSMPGLARIRVEDVWDSIFGGATDLGVHSGRYCVDKWSIGYLAFRVLLTAENDSLLVITQ